MDDPCKMYLYLSKALALFSGVFFLLILLSHHMIWSSFQSCLDIEFITLDLTIEFSVGRRRRNFFHNCSDKSVASWIWYHYLKRYLFLLNIQARVQSIDTLPETKPSMVYANNEILYLFCHWILFYIACKNTFGTICKDHPLLYVIGLATWTYYIVIPSNLSQ